MIHLRINHRVHPHLFHYRLVRNASAGSKGNLTRIVWCAERVIGCHLPSIKDLYDSRARKCAGKIPPLPKTLLWQTVQVNEDQNHLPLEQFLSPVL